MGEHGYQPAITIRDAINHIDENRYVLPAIQRRFVWQPEQIELLFDSIMRDYPINALMLWKISSEDNKKNYKFFSFLKKYVEKFGETNEEIKMRGKDKDFYAVIDGQQRLNSLYIGLKGTYAKRKKYKAVLNKDNYPPRKLYLNILNEPDSETMIDKKYDFQFLTENEVQRDNESQESFWYEVGEILNQKKGSERFKYLQDHGLSENSYAEDTLDKLSDVINVRSILTFFVENDQAPDKVLDIFIRMNDGGTKLTFSDLLMSVLTANWSEARENFDALIKEVDSNSNFTISSDWILKTTLVLFSNRGIKNRVKFFDTEMIDKIKNNWDKIRRSIQSTFEMFYRMGFRDETFPAKNAAIPIVLWVFDTNRQNEISKATFIEGSDDSRKIKKWLLLAFLKGIFGGQSDNVLTKVRKVIRNNNGNNFPIEDIILDARNEISKNYSFDDEVINGLLQSKYGTRSAFFILSLFYPHLDYFNQNFHIDHIHPKVKFNDSEWMNSVFSQEQINDINDKWNRIGNLELLNGERNESKNDKPLIQWASENHLTNTDFFVDDSVSLKVSNFEEFYDNRLENMRKKLIKMVSYNSYDPV